MGGGKIDPQLGLQDIQDDDLDTCLETHYLENEDGDDGDRKKISSSAFWCDGVTPPKFDKPKEKPVNRKGSVSESVCMAGKAPFWNHPATDSCVNLRSNKLSVFHKGICEDGKNSTLALYREKGCGGGKPMFMDLADEDMERCLDVGGSESFAFYCTGEGIQKPGLPANRDNGGSALHFLLVLSIIILMFFLMLLLSVWAWIRKYGGGVGRLIEIFTGLFKPKDGGIAL